MTTGMNGLNDVELDPRRTALVLIDLQNGVLRDGLTPYSAEDVLERAVHLVEAFHTARAQVVFVRVSFAPDRADSLRQPVDAAPAASIHKPGWDQLSPLLPHQDGDLVITKLQWGAFYGTGLDLQLRRRHLDTIVLGGISTNFGVESTARDAYERGYSILFAEDAMTSGAPGGHDFAVATIFPRLGHVRSTKAILASLQAAER